MVLLKNTGDILPLSKSGTKSILVVGPETLFPEGWEVRRFDDWKDFGRHLYSSFFDLDRVGCTLILAQLPEADGLGTAIANRLNKAAGI